MAHIVVEAAALAGNISHSPDIVGKPVWPPMSVHARLSQHSPGSRLWAGLGPLLPVAVCCPGSRAWPRRGWGPVCAFPGQGLPEQ